MECPSQESFISVVVNDTIQTSSVGKKVQRATMQFAPGIPVENIFKEISDTFAYNPDEISLTLHAHQGLEYDLNSHKNKTIKQIGILFSSTENYTITLASKSKKMSLYVQDTYDDELLLGASASPTTGEIPSTSTAREIIPAIEAVPISCNYVGLVNQAMTCYLNSLLQALYMTPEFRNALYNWEFDGVNESRSIPYQLQKLFLNLQTSSKSAVETTDLTTSFGWQGSDAWHQHDIQELCRVMFDALEQKFKDTKQANLINDLYEGKMLDYVKCLECGTEKSREDTFLDIPLPVRPFCSMVAYNSVEEALRAFVLPETLDGNNQYFCEKCNKKCDAHKGLKFTKFPYLLTLHLKRFDFDYNTMHRIKLNDKVVFPEKLNLNSFITSPHLMENESMEEKENVVKCDECSTTDSGSADDESCQGTDISSTVNGHDDNCVDSDEGIDVSLGTNAHDEDTKGPYVYELFSIMIHSGSASGGHYYAYIKDFDHNLWFCFNDQTVSRITEDDIRKTYGGGPLRGYYSGAYSSSTNAYMLMYRQINQERNARAMSIEEFPPHIKKLLEDMRRKEEEERRNKEKENDMVKVTVFCQPPTSDGPLQDVRLTLFADSTLEETKQDAMRRFKLESLNPSECRIVLYNRKQDCIDSSFESDQIRISDALRGPHWPIGHTDLLLEIKDSCAPWLTYNPGGINMRVYPIILETEEIKECKMVRVDVNDTVNILKYKLATLLDMDIATLKVVQTMYSNEPKYLEDEEQIVKFDSNCYDYKLYVSNGLDEDPEKTFGESKLKRLIEQQFGYVISLSVVLPETDIATLGMLSIPSLDLNQNLDKLELGSGDRGMNSPNWRVSPQLYQGDGVGDQSNSEDSSLSDSDRTLVGEAPGECCVGLLSSSPNSPADQHMASPSDPCEDNYNHDVLGHPGGDEMNWDDVETTTAPYPPSFPSYFKVTSLETTKNSTHFCRLLVDKRMTLESFKKQLEVVVRVPSEYFKIYRYSQGSEDEWSSLTDTLRSAKDGERLIVRLGRVLRKDEVKCTVYQLKMDVMEPNMILFDHIITKGQFVKDVKKDILIQVKKQHMLDIPFNKCRLREKSWKRPKKVYLDDQRFDREIRVSPNMEMYLQQIDSEKVTSTDQMVLFVRQWSPSTLSFKSFQEVVLDNLTVDELKQKISELSGIPVENVEVACVKANLPCDMNVLEVHGEHDWNPNATSLENWPLNVTDGNVFFYRDSKEQVKELTREERAELNQRENVRLGKPSMKSFSPGRERALKIYLDTSPASNNIKTEDNCFD